MNLIPGFVRSRIEHRPMLGKVLDNIGWLFFDKFIRLGLGLVVSVWVARYLGPEQFGLINFVTALVTLLAAFATLGLSNIVVRDLLREPDSKYEIIGTAAFLHVISGVAAYSLVVITVYLIRPDDSLAHTVTLILGSALLFNVSRVANYWFEAEVKSKYIVWVTNFVFFLAASLKVAMILLEYPLLAFAWAMLAETVLVALGSFLIFSIRGLKPNQLIICFKRVKAFIKDGWPLFASGIAIAIYMKIDMLMLGQMLDDKAVGIYGAAVRISEVWYFIPMMIVASVFPAILEAKNNSETLYLEHLQRLCDLMVLLSLIVVLPLTFCSGWLVNLLFGDDYIDAAPILALHIWASIFVFLGVAAGKWFIVENLQILSLQRAVFGAILNILLNMLLIPRLGLMGAAWATVLSHAASTFLMDAVRKETRAIFFIKCRSLNIFLGLKRLSELRVKSA